MGGDGERVLSAAHKLGGLIPAEAARDVPLLQPIKTAPFFVHAQFSALTPSRSTADNNREERVMRKICSSVGAICSAALPLALAVPAAAPAAQKRHLLRQAHRGDRAFRPGRRQRRLHASPAPFLEKHLPGNPTIIVRNIPGAR